MTYRISQNKGYGNANCTQKQGAKHTAGLGSKLPDTALPKSILLPCGKTCLARIDKFLCISNNGFCITLKTGIRQKVARKTYPLFFMMPEKEHMGAFAFEGEDETGMPAEEDEETEEAEAGEEQEEGDETTDWK
ncbi:MAG: hypothetical protein HY482_02190 [Candidatus Wildermuthbacteria bacterium]|nr:hypothetical protein [Candidatus Wildermuthbacteria bacterium]